MWSVVLTQPRVNGHKRKLVLEMKAADFGIQAFTINQSSINIYVSLKVWQQNYIKVCEMGGGGTVSVDLVQLTKNLLDYLLKKPVFLSTKHVKRILNVE